MPLDREEFMKNAMKGYKKQKTLLDKLTYLFNVEIYRAQVKHYREGLKKNNETDPLGFTADEKGEVPYTNLAEAKNDMNILDDYEETISNDILAYASQSEENTREFFRTMGLIKAEFETGYGKLRQDYENSDLFKDDPKRRQKLDYLVNNIMGNPYNEAIQEYKGYSLVFNDLTVNSEKGIPISKTKLKNNDYLKKTTIKQYIEENKLEKKGLEELLTKARNYHFDTEEDNMYDFMKAVYEDTGEHKDFVKDDPEEAAAKFNERFMDFVANNQYGMNMKYSQLFFATDIYRNNLSPEMKNCSLEGYRINGVVEEYGATALTDEEKAELNKIAAEGRMQRIKDTSNNASAVIFTDKALDMEKSEKYKKVYPKIDKNVSYKNYIKLHTGINAIASKDSFRTTLSKCIAAESLRSAKRDFDIKMLHRVAKRIEEFPTFNNLTNEDMAEILANPSKLGEVQKRFFREAHSVPEENVQFYIDSMKELHEHMMAKDGRSPEFKNLYNNIEYISKLDPNKAGFEERLMKANESLLQAVRLYTKGKEKVRTFKDGKERFNNAIDALEIMYECVPGLQKTIEGMVAGYNKIRGVESINDPNYIFINDYGTDRVVQAHIDREKAKNPEAKGVNPLEGRISSSSNFSVDSNISNSSIKSNNSVNKNVNKAVKKK